MATVGVARAVSIPVVALTEYIDTVLLSALVTYTGVIQVMVTPVTFALAIVPVLLVISQANLLGIVPAVTA